MEAMPMSVLNFMALISFAITVAKPLWLLALKTYAFVHKVYELIVFVVCTLYCKFVEDVASSVSNKIGPQVEDIIDETLKDIEQKQQKIDEEQPPLLSKNKGESSSIK